jgi:uroporphyrinogen decarboxylase
MEDIKLCNSTKRERVLRALTRKETDKVPVDLGGKLSSIALSSYEDLKILLGVEEITNVLDERLQIATIADEILKKYEVDTRYIYQNKPKSWDPQWDGDTFVDEWGMVLRKPVNGFYYDYINAPMANCKNKKDINSYSWPNVLDMSRNEGSLEKVKALQDQDSPFIITTLKGTFEMAWALRGIENFFEDLVVNQSFAEELLDKVLDVQMEIYGPFFEEIAPYLDMVAFTDDVGGQNTLIISPKMYREIIKPRHKKMVEFIKTKANALTAYHTCGSVFELIPDIYEIGVDVLNPIQTSAKDMNIEIIKSEYGKYLSFWGAIDVQKTLPFGTEKEVRETVKQTISILGNGGGYLLAPAHNIQAKTPAENIHAVYDEALNVSI